MFKFGPVATGRYPKIFQYISFVRLSSKRGEFKLSHKYQFRMYQNSQIAGYFIFIPFSYILKQYLIKTSCDIFQVFEIT